MDFCRMQQQKSLKQLKHSLKLLDLNKTSPKKKEIIKKQMGIFSSITLSKKKDISYTVTIFRGCFRKM